VDLAAAKHPTVQEPVVVLVVALLDKVMQVELVLPPMVVAGEVVLVQLVLQTQAAQ
jgi:hypothetical protein